MKEKRGADPIQKGGKNPRLFPHTLTLGLKSSIIQGLPQKTSVIGKDLGAIEHSQKKKKKKSDDRDRERKLKKRGFVKRKRKIRTGEKNKTTEQDRKVAAGEQRGRKLDR